MVERTIATKQLKTKLFFADSLADAYEAMTSPRPYRERPLSHKEALVELRRNIGTQFDPKVAMVFVNIMKKKSPVKAGTA